MGLIRKTFSVGTFGLVSFRSKKERLRRAERSQRAAELSLEDEHKARIAAEDRVTRADKRVKQARAEAEYAARQLERKKQKKPKPRRKHRKAEVMAAVLADATVRSRKAARRARKAAKISPAD